MTSSIDDMRLDILTGVSELTSFIEDVNPSLVGNRPKGPITDQRILCLALFDFTVGIGPLNISSTWSEVKTTPLPIISINRDNIPLVVFIATDRLLGPTGVTSPSKVINLFANSNTSVEVRDLERLIPTPSHCVIKA